MSELRREADSSRVPLEVLVVDNGGTEEETELLRSLPGARTIVPGRNLGYAGGLNRGASEARGDTLLFLNPDLEFRPGFLTPLLAALHSFSSTRVGAAGPRFVWDPEGRFILPPLWVPRLGGELARLRARRGRRGREALRRIFQRQARREWEATAPTVVPGLVGAGFAVPRPVWETVGPFDEAFPLYFEDTDWFARLARRRLEAVLVPGSVAIHLAGRSTARDAEEAARKFGVSERLFRRAHWSGPERALFAAAGWLIRPRAVPAVPSRRDPLALSFDVPGRALIEFSPLPEGAPGVGCYAEGGGFSFSAEDWERVPDGPWFVRVTDLGKDRVVLETAFAKGA